MRTGALSASASAVSRVLHQAGYESVPEPTRPHPSRACRFERARPNQLWQTDLFTFMLKRQNRRLYLVAFMDDHSRFIVSYGLHASASTALVIEAFADHIRASGEGKPDMTVEVVVDGRVHKEVRIGPDNLFSYDNKLVLEGDAVTTGSHRIELRRRGRGAGGRPLHDAFDYSDVIAGRKSMTDTIDQDLSLLAHAQRGMHSEGFTGTWLNERLNTSNAVSSNSVAINDSAREIPMLLHTKFDKCTR